jgi:hypothetical protein
MRRQQMHILQNRMAEQVGRQMQKQQNRLLEMQMQADADECTARVPDCQICRWIDMQDNQIARCIARCIARRVSRPG